MKTNPFLTKELEAFEKEFVFFTAKWPKTIGRQPAQPLLNWLKAHDARLIAAFTEAVKGIRLKEIPWKASDDFAAGKVYGFNDALEMVANLLKEWE